MIAGKPWRGRLFAVAAFTIRTLGIAEFMGFDANPQAWLYIAGTMQIP